MPEVLSLDNVGLQSKGNTLSLTVEQGQSICIVGPAASGKSRLAAILAKTERPARGTIHAPSKIELVTNEELPRRSKPLGLARRSTRSATRVAEVLTALSLWELRQRPLSHLSDAQRQACSLIEALSGTAPLIILDGSLDGLDPWTLPGTLALLSERVSRGTVLVVTTNRPELVDRFDAVIVLNNQDVAFAGSVSELLRRGIGRELRITSTSVSGVRALIAPFQVNVRETKTGLEIQAKEGQSIAARLLLEGYGSVDFVYMQPQTVESALSELV